MLDNLLLQFLVTLFMHLAAMGLAFVAGGIVFPVVFYLAYQKVVKMVLNQAMANVARQHFGGPSA